jgi:hypothetical protein
MSRVTARDKIGTIHNISEENKELIRPLLQEDNPVTTSSFVRDR